MQAESQKLILIDYADSPDRVKDSVPEPLPESFGYSLDTVEKAREWLTNPQNWFKSELFIIRWDGLLPRISEKHGRRLIAEPWDNGLPEVIVWEQRQRRSRRDEPEAPEKEPQETADE